MISSLDIFMSSFSYRLRHWPGTDFCGPLSKTTGIPRNRFDAACKKHDQAYARIAKDYPFKSHYVLYNQADEDFIDDLRLISGLGPDVARVWFIWKKALNAGPAAPTVFMNEVRKELPYAAGRTLALVKNAGKKLSQSLLQITKTKKRNVPDDPRDPDPINEKKHAIRPDPLQEKISVSDQKEYMTSFSNNYCCVELPSITIGNKTTKMSKASTETLGQWSRVINESKGDIESGTGFRHWGLVAESVYDNNNTSAIAQPVTIGAGEFNSVQQLESYMPSGMTNPTYNGSKITDIGTSRAVAVLKNQKMQITLRNETVSTEATPLPNHLYVSLYVVKCVKDVYNIAYGSTDPIDLSLQEGWVQRYTTSGSNNPPISSPNQSPILGYQDNPYYMNHFKVLTKREFCLNYDQTATLDISMPGVHWHNYMHRCRSTQATDGVQRYERVIMKEGQIGVLLGIEAGLDVQLDPPDVGKAKLMYHVVRSYSYAFSSLGNKSTAIHDNSTS